MMTEGIKILERDKQLSISEILNFFSSRFFSFTILAEREGFINPFLKLLNSPDKNTKMP